MCEFVVVRRKRWVRFLTKEGGERAMERRGSTFGAMGTKLPIHMVGFNN
jgi:hypothetical protein